MRTVSSVAELGILDGVVQTGDENRRRADLPIILGGEVAEKRRCQQAAGTDRKQMQLVDPADFAHDAARLKDRIDIGVEAPIFMRDCRIAPADDEDLHSMIKCVFDEAASGREIKRVKFVDHRRRDQDRNCVHFRRAWPVLDNLDNVRPQNNDAGRDREVATDLIFGFVDLRGHTPVFRQVRQKVLQAVQCALSARFNETPHRARIAHHRVGGRQSVGQVVDEIAGSLDGDFVESNEASHIIHAFGPGQIALHVGVIEWIVGPLRIRKTPVAGLRLYLGLSRYEPCDSAHDAGLLLDRALPRKRLSEIG